MISNLGLRGGYYENEQNKPSWFPDSLQFKCPTHPKSGFNKRKWSVVMNINLLHIGGQTGYKHQEMILILGTFFEKCPHMYKMYVHL